MSEQSDSPEQKFYHPIVVVESDNPVVQKLSKAPIIGKAVEAITSYTETPQRYVAVGEKEAREKAESYAEFLRTQGKKAKAKIVDSKGRGMF